MTSSDVMNLVLSDVIFTSFFFKPIISIRGSGTGGDGLRKVISPKRGPFEVTHVYANGSAVPIQRGNINERVNIRHLTPFVDET